MRRTLSFSAAVLAFSVLGVAMLSGCGESSAVVAPDTQADVWSARGESELEIDIVVSPNTLVLASSGDWVTVHADIPLAQVSDLEITLDRVPVSWTKADNHGDLVAKFQMSEIKGIVTPGDVTLVLRGTTVEGVPFVGSDAVTVKPGSADKL